jgi:hypothetical protein
MLLELLAFALTTDCFGTKKVLTSAWERKRHHKCKSRSDIRWSTPLLYHIMLGNGDFLFPSSGLCQSHFRTYAVGVQSLRQSGTLHFHVCGFFLGDHKNRTQTIGKYHAAAGKKCGFEMRNNATAYS